MKYAATQHMQTFTGNPAYQNWSYWTDPRRELIESLATRCVMDASPPHQWIYPEGHGAVDERMDKPR